MQEKAQSTKSQFTAKVLSALEEVKEKYSQRLHNDAISIAPASGNSSRLFGERVKFCKKMLENGGTLVQSDTLIKIDALKLKLNQISVDDLRRSFNRRNDLSLDNIKRTLEEIDGRDCNNILNSLEFTDFAWVKHQDEIDSGVRGLERTVMRHSFKTIARADCVDSLAALSDKAIFIRKNEVLIQLRALSASFSLNVKVTRLSECVQAAYREGTTRAKRDGFVSLRCYGGIIAMADAQCQESNVRAIVLLRQFALVFKISVALRKAFSICAKSIRKTAIAPLRRACSTSKGLSALSQRVKDVQRHCLKIGLRQLSEYAKSTSRDSGKLYSLKNSANPTSNDLRDKPLIPVNSLATKPRSMLSKRSMGNSDAKKHRPATAAARNSDLKLNSKDDVKHVVKVVETGNRYVGEGVPDFQMSDTVVSEILQPERSSLGNKLAEQTGSMVESRIIHNKSGLRAQDDIGNLTREFNKNDSMSKIDINSCLKESVPDSDFVKYCETVFNSKKINYNFSLDHIEGFRNSRQRTDNDGEKGESSSFNENGPNFRDIEQWMHFAKKPNSSYELKDQTLDFLKSVDVDSKHRSSYNTNSEVSQQKKESIKLVNEKASGYDDVELCYVEIDASELKDSAGLLYSSVIEDASKTFSPPQTTKCQMDAIREKRELTAIKEESTLFDKSNCTISKNYSYTIEGKDPRNSPQQPSGILDAQVHAEALKRAPPKSSRRKKISPRNLDLAKDATDGSRVIQYTEELKGNDAAQRKLEAESCSSSNSSDVKPVSHSAKPNVTPRLQHAVGSRPSIAAKATGKRASLNDRFNTTINFTEQRRPPSYFDLRKRPDSIKCAAGQHKNTTVRQGETRQPSKAPRVAKNLTAQTLVAGPPRLRLNTLEVKPTSHHINTSIRGQLRQHQSLVTPTVSCTKPRPRPISNLRRALTPQVTDKAEGVVPRDTSKNRAQKDLTSGKKVKPSSKLSPAPLFRNAQALHFDKQGLVSQGRSKNFVDVNKRHAFENNIAKYFPKFVESRNKLLDRSISLNVSRSVRKAQTQLTRAGGATDNGQAKISRAHSTQHKASHKSSFNASLVLNKENGPDSNTDARASHKTVQQPTTGKSSEPGTKRDGGSLIGSAKQDRSRFRQRKADSKFFSVN